MRSCARFRFATFCNSFRERRVNGGITETKVPYPPYPCLPRIAESGRRARAGRARDRLICQEAAQCVDMPRRSIPARPKSTERPGTCRLRQRDQFRDTDDRNLDCPRNGGRRHRSTPGNGERESNSVAARAGWWLRRSRPTPSKQRTKTTFRAACGASPRLSRPRPTRGTSPRSCASTLDRVHQRTQRDTVCAVTMDWSRNRI